MSSFEEKKMKLYQIVAMLSVAAGGAQSFGASILANGDFESGNTGFTSAYTYSPGASGGLPEGTYDVRGDSQTWNPNFTNAVTPHSGNNMLVVNGANPALTVWEQTVAVEPDTLYSFSLWATSLYSASPAGITVTFVPPGTTSAVNTLSTNVPDWTQYTFGWYSGTATTLTISITDTNTAPNGNDFALDDLSLQAVTGGATSVPLPASVYGGAALFAGMLVARRMTRRA
jgi:hypothetical protein